MTVHDIRPPRSIRRAVHTARERRVLLALSHPSDRRSVEHALERLDPLVRSTADPASTLAVLDAFDPDVVVLDARDFHPAVTPVAAAVRERPRIAIVVVGGNTREQRLTALRLGVDDVVSTDTPADEIALRCLNLAKRTAVGESAPTAIDDGVRTFGPVVLDTDRREIRVNGHVVPTTKLEYELFARICRTPFQVVTRAELIESVWGTSWFGDSHVVDVHLSNLRRKLRHRCSTVDYWCTVRGVGFRLADDLDTADRATAEPTRSVRIAG